LGKNLKLHQNIVTGIIECLKLIFLENKYTDDVLEKAFRNHKQWGSRDRKFIGNSVYECVRWWRLYSEACNTHSEDLLQVEKVLAVHFIQNDIEIPEWYIIKDFDVESIKKNLFEKSATRKFKASIPNWLDELGSKELGDDRWATEINALNAVASVILRVNTLNSSTEELIESLAVQEIEVEEIPDYEDALMLKKRQVLSKLNEYQNGLFEIQDAGSQAIAPFLHVKQGMTVIDACAGGGGKTLHLATIMQNQGQITAMDIVEKKLENLKTRAQRAGTIIVNTCLATEESIKSLANTADRLLLDVPCSGLGVLKRNPDAKWKLSETEIEEVKLKQERILDQYPSMLKSGGMLVYATCSILPSENTEQIIKFLKKYPKEYQLIEEKQIWPSEGFDGFYMARLRKL
jgi:16S rRNA (cytosine967-C5)-methyltransferase